MPKYERKGPPPAPPKRGALPPVQKARGLVGVRKLSVKILQQQLESLADRVITAEDREFLIEAVKVLVSGEKVVRAPGKGVEAHGAPLPPLATGGAT